MSTQPVQEYRPVPLPDYQELPLDEMRRRAQAFYDEIRTRHTVRDFSSRPVPRDIIETCIRAAGTAPNGANHQLALRRDRRPCREKTDPRSSRSRGKGVL